jgi:hypothetical protein
MNNPFGITKATDFSDEEINDYWVDIKNICKLDISDSTPIYILGSKGCGKTHLLRHYSYPLQKICKQNLLAILKDNKYIGVYSILNAIDSSRFSKKGIDEEQWKALFKYYLELYISEILLNIVKEIFAEKLSGKYTEGQFVDNILSKFYDIIFDNDKTIGNLLIRFSEIRKSIDFQIVNAAFTQKLNDIKIQFTPGTLLFEIPKFLQKNIDIMKDVRIIYILDEYEKLFEWQKEFINTLVWDKKTPSTFWIGARRYGYTTTKTETGENLKPNSEFKFVYLDDILCKNEKEYQKFAKDLCICRLKKHFKNFSEEKIFKVFSRKFEKYSDKIIIENLQNKKEYKHITDLKQRIQDAIKEDIFQTDIEKCIEKIIDGIDNPLEQKYRIYLLYREWANWGTAKSKIPFTTNKEKINIDKIIIFVKKQYELHRQNEKSEFFNIIEKYKSDFLAQLAYENKIKNTCYSGIDEFIKLSCYNPRIFLSVLKLIIERSRLLGEEPLEDNSEISLNAQYLGIIETAKWFYEDIEIIGNEGKNLNISLNNLANIFQMYRFSDKPTETSVCAFNYSIEKISSEANHYIKLAKEHFLIIPVEKRKQRNSGREESTYQLHKILSPLWNLPYSRRGIADLSTSMIEVIFDPKRHKEFESIYRKEKSKFMAPFFSGKKTNKNDLPSLF